MLSSEVNSFEVITNTVYIIVIYNSNVWFVKATKYLFERNKTSHSVTFT